MILETSTKDDHCLNFLLAKGYLAFDLNTYKQVQRLSDYPQQAGIRNNLYVHETRMSDSPYTNALQFKNITEIMGRDFRYNGSTYLSNNDIPLKQGRYRIWADFLAQGKENSMMCGVNADERTIFRYHAYTQMLAEHYFDWIVDIETDTNVQFFFQFTDSRRDPSFKINRITIEEIIGFKRSQNIFI